MKLKEKLIMAQLQVTNEKHDNALLLKEEDNLKGQIKEAQIQCKKIKQETAKVKT